MYIQNRYNAIITIIFRNVFLLINIIIFAVVILLTIFGDSQEGIFLGLITILNIVIGCIQEIRAWLTLEKLQLLAISKLVRLNEDNTESLILAEEIKRDERIKLKIGDQVPCDGILDSSHGFEVNEALITGESNTILKKPGDKIFAGSIITSGGGLLKTESIFSESRIAHMTKSIKKYSLIQSPIQYSINLIIKYTSYSLLVIILFVVLRGFLVHESTVNIIQNIGALTSTLLPQGIVVIVTLIFSYGAAHLYKRNVLLQEINATEKIGRIKNLCMDKTGTLTDNNLVVEHMYSALNIPEKKVVESVTAYIKGTGDSSQTIQAVEKMFLTEFKGTILDDLTFSSTRQYGAVQIQDDFGERVILAGAPDIFLPFFSDEKDKEWIKKYIDTEAKIGKRLICFAESNSHVLPYDLSGIKLSALSVFVLNNSLREGVMGAVDFFQNRGVIIRIISGDNPKTVQAVATLSGVKNTDAIITGAELEKWTEDDFFEKVHNYTIFARIKPEQKEKIIIAFKKNGFTAMIGDGANDALAIKKADLGIAMFDGAQATRQIAAIVLVKNSFTDLPNGVKLADSIIQNIEICSAIFFNQVFLGFFFFLMLTFFGYSFPFTPLNITFINYFTVGLLSFLIFYWIIRPVNNNVVRQDQSYLKRVIPFALVSAIPQAVVALVAFYSSLEHIRSHGPTSLVVLSFIVVGVVFFMFTPGVYSETTTKKQKKQFIFLILIICISIIVMINIPLIESFYNLKVPSLHSLLELVPLMILYIFIQYGVAYWFSEKNYLICITKMINKISKKKALFLIFSSIVVVLIGLILFIKLDTQQAANFSDLVLRPLIGDAPVIALEKIFFNSSDSLNQLKYSVVPIHNPFLGKETSLISATDTMAYNSNLDFASVPTNTSVPLSHEGQWFNIPLTLFPNQIVAADTFIRPDSARPYAFVTLVQIDTSKMSLWSVAGVTEPGGKVGKSGPGVVPENIQKQGILIAAFAGGFQYRDGQYGMIVGTTTYLSLKKDIATLVGHTDGRLEIVKYEGQNLGTNISFIRQNCPMLIENGIVETQDESNNKLWGRTNTTDIYTWRSGIGITAQGNLIYAIGNSLVPSTLAAALKAAGAVNAMQLDINPYWVRFNIFNNYSKGKYTSNTIMEGVTNGSYAYLNGYNKDFFYITKK